MKWLWINSSKIGTSHLNSEHPKNQDAHFVYLTQNNILISAIADGAGSTTFGGYGAWITCRIIKNFFIKWYSSKTYHPSEDTVRILINDIRYQLLKTAQKRKTEFRNFASTLSVVLASKEETVFFSIGDSPIVAKSNNIWGVTTCPDVGEYASTTFFTTEKNFPRMQFIRSKTIFSAFALMSDGVGKISINERNLSPSSKFFQPILDQTKKSSTIGKNKLLSNQLGAFLESKRVSSKTEDDKTLIFIGKSYE